MMLHSFKKYFYLFKQCAKRFYFYDQQFFNWHLDLIAFGIAQYLLQRKRLKYLVPLTNQMSELWLFWHFFRKRIIFFYAYLVEKFSYLTHGEISYAWSLLDYIETIYYEYDFLYFNKALFYNLIILIYAKSIFYFNGYLRESISNLPEASLRSNHYLMELLDLNLYEFDDTVKKENYPQLQLFSFFNTTYTTYTLKNFIQYGLNKKNNYFNQSLKLSNRFLLLFELENFKKLISINSWKNIFYLNLFSKKKEKVNFSFFLEKTINQKYFLIFNYYVDWGYYLISYHYKYFYYTKKFSITSVFVQLLFQFSLLKYKLDQILSYDFQKETQYHFLRFKFYNKSQLFWLFYDIFENLSLRIFNLILINGNKQFLLKLYYYCYYFIFQNYGLQSLGLLTQVIQNEFSIPLRIKTVTRNKKIIAKYPELRKPFAAQTILFFKPFHALFHLKDQTFLSFFEQFCFYFFRLYLIDRTLIFFDNLESFLIGFLKTRVFLHFRFQRKQFKYTTRKKIPFKIKEEELFLKKALFKYKSYLDDFKDTLVYKKNQIFKKLIFLKKIKLQKILFFKNRFKLLTIYRNYRYLRHLNNEYLFYHFYHAFHGFTRLHKYQMRYFFRTKKYFNMLLTRVFKQKKYNWTTKHYFLKVQYHYTRALLLLSRKKYYKANLKQKRYSFLYYNMPIYFLNRKNYFLNKIFLYNRKKYQFLNNLYRKNYYIKDLLKFKLYHRAEDIPSVRSSPNYFSYLEVVKSPWYLEHLRRTKRK